MKRLLLAALCGVAMTVAGGAGAQAPSVGAAAPTFVAKDLAGKPVALSDFKGKYVVLEWTNPDCPYVRKHYNSGNMPTTQKQAVGKGVVWLSVSTGDTHSVNELRSWQKDKSATPTATLTDADGKIARAYGARGTLARTIEEVRKGVQEWVASPGPMIIDSRISKAVINLPMRRTLYGKDE